MKKCVLGVLMLAAMTSATLAAEEGKVVQVIYIGEITAWNFRYHQFDETGALRVCTLLRNSTYECGPWIKSEEG